MNALMPLNVPARVKLTIADFMLIEASGAFNGIATTELIDGEIIGTRAHYRGHSHGMSRLAFGLAEALASLNTGLAVLAGVTVAMPPHDAPHPDIVLTSEARGEGFCPIASVALLVEVADTTIEIDMRQKATIYAKHGVPEYWVVDLNAARIVRMWRPEPGGYGEADETPFGTPLAAVTIAGLAVDTGGLV